MNKKYMMGFPKEGLTVKPDYASRKNQESLFYIIWEEDADVFSSIIVKRIGMTNVWKELNENDQKAEGSHS